MLTDFYLGLVMNQQVNGSEIVGHRRVEGLVLRGCNSRGDVKHGFKRCGFIACSRSETVLSEITSKIKDCFSLAGVGGGNLAVHMLAHCNNGYALRMPW
jgi:hypothetical protein